MSRTGSHDTAASLLSCKPGRPQTHPGHLCCPGLVEGQCLALTSQTPQGTVLSVHKASHRVQRCLARWARPSEASVPTARGGLRRPWAAQGRPAASALREAEQAIQPHASTGAQPARTGTLPPMGLPLARPHLHCLQLRFPLCRGQEGPSSNQNDNGTLRPESSPHLLPGPRCPRDRNYAMG